jgi:hypothetical protein
MSKDRKGSDLGGSAEQPVISIHRNSNASEVGLVFEHREGQTSTERASFERGLLESI